jgi:hypothetical protein
MVTALGSAVIIDPDSSMNFHQEKQFVVENINVESIRLLQKRRELINNANSKKLSLDKETWEFISKNKVFEVYDYLLTHFKKLISTQSDSLGMTWENIHTFLESLDDEKKGTLIYETIVNEDNDYILDKFCQVIKKNELLDWDYIMKIIEHNDFKKQKMALKLLTFDKPYYNKSDIGKIRTFIDIIKTKFPERGVRSSKKGLFSSKEKDVWVCECKVSNELDSYCKGCSKDIYGFTSNEVSPNKLIPLLEEKINLISEFV